MKIKSLSASKVDCFFGCQRLFLYRYIQKEPSEGNKYFLIGNIVHRALELFHKNINITDKYGKLMSKAFKSAFDKNEVGDRLDDGLIGREDLLVIKGILANYVKKIANTDKLPNTLYVETLFKTTIGNQTVWGKADRVDVDDGTVKVVDYKTSKTLLTKKDVANSVQLPTYGIWIRDVYKQPYDSIVGEYYYVKHIGTKKECRSFEITDDMMAEAIEKYFRVRYELDNNCKFVKNREYKYCYTCEYSNKCINDN